jgi:hypothetical protein
MIRSDEPGQFGTSLTISQWLSVAIVIAGCGLWAYIELAARPKATLARSAPQS